MIRCPALQTADNNAMHAKSGLRVFLKWKIYRPDSVIAAVMPLSIREIECIHLNVAAVTPSQSFRHPNMPDTSFSILRLIYPLTPELT
jgi:hypothetical protein